MDNQNSPTMDDQSFPTVTITPSNAPVPTMNTNGQPNQHPSWAQTQARAQAPTRSQMSVSPRQANQAYPSYPPAPAPAHTPSPRPSSQPSSIDLNKDMNEIDQLKGQIEQLKKTICQLKDTIDSCQRWNYAPRTEAPIPRASNASAISAESVLTQLTSTRNDFDSKYNNLINEQIQNKKDLEEKIQEQNIEIKKLQVDLQVAQQATANYEQQTENFKRQIDSLERHAEEHKKTHDSLVSLLNELIKNQNPDSHKGNSAEQLKILKHLQEETFATLEKGKASLSDDINSLVRELKAHVGSYLSNQPVQNEPQLVALLRQYCSQANSSSIDEILLNKLPQLYVMVCRLADRRNDRRLISYITGKGFEPLHNLGMEVIYPAPNSAPNNSEHRQTKTVASPNPTLRGHIATCSCPGLKVRGNVFAQAEVTIYS